MNEQLLQPEIQEWINNHLNINVYDLTLKKSPFKGVSMQELAQQIQGKKIAQKKFPYLAHNTIIYPPKINLEQTSSQSTAEYKRNIINGKTIADVTGGFGIDSIFFSQKFEQVYHFELNENLQKISTLNFKKLGLNIISKNGNGIENILDFNDKLDVIFIDPSRRDKTKNKVFLLEDLTPNILEILPALKAKASTLLIKLSPLIDIQYLVKTIPNISEIHLVALKNELKEVLIKLDNTACSTKIICTNLQSTQSRFSFEWNDIKTNVQYSEIEKFIYEPNVSVQKSGGINLLGTQLGLKKLHPNTQLLTSNKLIQEFPGRIFEMGEIIKKPKKTLKNKSIMAIHRNFPENLTILKKRYNFTSDGTLPVLFTQTKKEKVIALATLVKS